MNKRFLLVTEEWAGSGHKMAAVALEEALRERQEVESVRIVGGLETASPVLRELSRFFYVNMLRYGQPVWQRIYEQERVWGAALKKPVGWWLSGRLTEAILNEEKPDVVIATHAYCLSALAEAKQRVRHPYHLVSIPTDYHVNRFWVHPQIDTYIVAHEQVAQRLTHKYGVEQSRIHGYGIPIRRAFSTNTGVDKGMGKELLGLSPDVFTVLISGGEGGYGQMDLVVKQLTKSPLPLQIVVVTGTNQSLHNRLKDTFQRTSSAHRIEIRGYERDMWKWIIAADVYVTKPGGMSCAEALALRTPLIVYQPLPGQERHNTAFLLKHQAGIWADTPEQIANFVEQLRESHNWQRMAASIEQIRRPQSTQEAVEYLLRL